MFGKYKKMYLTSETENTALKDKVRKLEEQLTSYQTNYRELTEKIDSIENSYSNLKDMVGKAEPTLNDIHERKLALDEECNILNVRLEHLKKEYIDLDDNIELQNIGHYEMEYASSDIYDSKLQELRDRQKEMEKDGTACNCKLVFNMNSKKMASAFTKNNMTHILRSFNLECATVIKGVRYSNYESCINKINKAFDFYNGKNCLSGIVIAEEYKQLKIRELKLMYERAKKKQEEREELRRQREIEREEKLLMQELEDERERLEIEQSKYERERNRLLKKLEDAETDEERQNIKERLDSVEKHLGDIEIGFKQVEDREANLRAGWVYIISNIGAFGEDIYKIGMTRRLDPQDRIDELSSASVPFKFDIHATIFSDDAPALEAALHRAFEDKKVNLVNGRKEFFNVPLEEIEKVVLENYDGTVDFKYYADADQYRESVAMRNSQ